MRIEVWVALSVVVATASRARAGNDDSFFQGNEAAMMGGAVAATGEGAGQLWYNPAGLGTVERNRLELSGSVFTLRVRGLEPYMELTDASLVSYGANRETSVELLTVPSALSYTRQLAPGVRAGVGVFVQAQDAVDLDSELVLDDGAGSRLDYRRALTFVQQRMFAGPGIGVDLGALRVGASLFLAYERASFEEISSVLGSLPGGVVASATEEYRVDYRRLGLELVLGAQLKLGERFRLGVVLRAPRIRLSDRASESRVATESIGTPGDAVTGADDTPLGDGDLYGSRVIAAPAKLVVSLGYVADGLKLGAEMEVAHEYAGFFFYIWTYNFRAGVSYAVSDGLDVGLGFFTDRANVGEGTGAFASFVDYYGGSVAASLATPVGVRVDEGEDGPTQLVFRTTVALRYAAGVGDGAGAAAFIDAIDGDASAENYAESGVFAFGADQRLLHHEVSLYIGSGLDF